MPIDEMIGWVSAGMVLILKTLISPALMRIPRVAGRSNIYRADNAPRPRRIVLR
jgi:hypothetical protein